ncbi:hypothetical protein IWX49DRAFT_303010 [Phyllosticta citricarpa]|uniref:Uncharacterized protein n=1 Tax=Phyllosticta citricarpa TaxID=55181 RepID=A0ABR1LKT5_9PEZI
MLDHLAYWHRYQQDNGRNGYVCGALNIKTIQQFYLRFLYHGACDKSLDTRVSLKIRRKSTSIAASHLPTLDLPPRFELACQNFADFGQCLPCQLTKAEYAVGHFMIANSPCFRPLKKTMLVVRVKAPGLHVWHESEFSQRSDSAIAQLSRMSSLVSCEGETCKIVDTSHPGLVAFRRSRRLRDSTTTRTRRHGNRHALPRQPRRHMRYLRPLQRHKTRE